MNAIANFFVGTVTRKIVTASVASFLVGGVTYKVVAGQRNKRSKLSPKEAETLLKAAEDCILNAEKTTDRAKMVEPLMVAVKRYRKMELKDKAQEIVEPLIRLADSFVDMEVCLSEEGLSKLRAESIAAVDKLKGIAPTVPVQLKKAA